MSFLVLPLWAVLGGVVALAAAVFGLQVLRARQKRIALAGAPLWARALRAAPLRVFRERFQRWLAYLLILAICLLLWLAGARPELAPSRDAALHVFYLDASAALTGRDEFDQARRALLADVRAVDPARRVVYLGDDPATLLLRPGENVSLLARRLDGVRPAARPSAFRDFVAGVDHPEASGQSVIHYYGNWGSAGQVRASNDRQTLAFGYLARPVADNRGVTALGVSPAASGAWGKADVYIEAMDAAGRPVAPDQLRITRGDRELSSVDQVADNAGVRLRDVDADGETLTVALRRGDAFSADDQAQLVLPDRRPVRIALSPGTPTAIREVVRLDGAFEAVPVGQAAVVVRRAGETFGADLPAMVLAPASSQPAFLFTYEAEAEAQDLSEALDRLGVARLDVGALAARTGRPVSVETEIGPHRQAALWSALYDDQGGFANAAQMPAFTSRVLRWLADPAPWIPYAAAGEELVDQSALYGLGRDPALTRRTLGGQVYLEPETHAGSDDRTITVSLTDRSTTAGAAARAPDTVSVRRLGGASIDLLFILLVLAAGSLLLLEWRLHHRGLMA